MAPTVIPKPYQLWQQDSRDTIFPFMLLFSIGWSFEMYVLFLRFEEKDTGLNPSLVPQG